MGLFTKKKKIKTGHLVFDNQYRFVKINKIIHREMEDSVNWALEDALHKNFELFIKDHLLVDGFFDATDFLEDLTIDLRVTRDMNYLNFYKISYIEKPFTILAHRLDSRYDAYSHGGQNLPLFLPKDAVIFKEKTIKI
jgi:hypothetical protein